MKTRDLIISWLAKFKLNRLNRKEAISQKYLAQNVNMCEWGSTNRTKDHNRQIILL